MERVPVKEEHASTDSDDDPDIIVVKKEYELKLAQMRAAAVKKEPVVKREQSDRLVVHRNPDGRVHVTQRPPKDEPPAKPDAAEPKAPTEDELDPWTRAAMASMNARDKAKKDAAKLTQTDKRKRDADSDTAPADAATPRAGVMRRPAANTAGPVIKKGKNAGKKKKSKKAPKTNNEPMKVKKEPKVKTEPMKSGKKQIKSDPDEPEVPKSKIMKSMPNKLPSDGSSPKPIKYWGGIIYTAAKAKKFRALRVRGDRWTEASASWGGDKPSKDAWRKCVKAIDDHHKK